MVIGVAELQVAGVLVVSLQATVPGTAKGAGDSLHLHEQAEGSRDGDVGYAVGYVTRVLCMIIDVGAWERVLRYVVGSWVTRSLQRVCMCM